MWSLGQWGANSETDLQRSVFSFWAIEGDSEPADLSVSGNLGVEWQTLEGMQSVESGVAGGSGNSSTKGEAKDASVRILPTLRSRA